MRKITTQQADFYLDNGFEGHPVGFYFEEYGAFIGEHEFIVYVSANNESYLAHRSEFEFSDVFVRPYHPENTTPLPNFDDVFEVKEY